jgi:hypothetical protein
MGSFFMKITQEENEYIKGFCERHKIFSQQTLKNDNRSLFFRYIFFFLFKKHGIAPKTTASWYVKPSTNIYQYMECVWRTGVDFKELAEGWAEFPVTIRANDEFKDCAERLRKQLKLRGISAVFRCFLLKMMEYQNKIEKVV